MAAEAGVALSSSGLFYAFATANVTFSIFLWFTFSMAYPDM